MLGNAKQADQKLGAAVYQEIQILRFLADTAAVNRHEAVLKFITDRGNATRAEIEAYYRNGIRRLVSEMVDEQVRRFNARISNEVLSAIKNTITDFILTPSSVTYNALLVAYRRYMGDGASVLGHTMGEINQNIFSALVNNRVLGLQ
jgi:hypothetical protein